ncbi:hypothetical protein ACLBV5_09550 [Brevundimonas sp. M1A4_2e]
MTSTYTGRRSGKLTIRSTFQKPSPNPKRSYTFAICECDCGATKEMNVTTFPFAKSCGCARSDPNAKSKTRLYSVWTNMISRTTKPTHAHFENYGGRGIKPDPDWLVFENFKAWSEANGYADHLSLERRDNDVGYNPANCLWIARSEQNKNRRSNKMNQTRADDLRAKRLSGASYAHLATEFGISQAMVSNIINGIAWKPPAPVCPCCGK